MAEWTTWWCRLLGYPGGCAGLSPFELATAFGLALAAAVAGVLLVFKLASKI
ncbi:hypothetical protein [Microvirga arabica]|uniref:hypothetical protein n=1 Tax=Microvirga arabica TaxID=1128671 RepID=UPI00193A5358|nr:hypothetical protein [Microvirga arabica]MBM1172006.1 hypothetical protein [Microvirga arabica]